MTQKRLEGKVAIITGATGGIGEATAKRYLEEGASVMLVGRSAEKLKDTRGRLSGFEMLADFVADATFFKDKWDINPIGVEFEAEDWLKQIGAGVPESDFLERKVHEPISPIRGNLAGFL